jgi:hypothetical protein
MIIKQNILSITSSRSLALILLLALSFVATESNIATAENKSIYTTKKHQVTFEPPQGSKPGQTVGGASRGGQCSLDSMMLEDLPFTPLLPMDSKALTTESHPTLMVYQPKTSATKALLSVKDATENYDYQAIMPISDRSGIISLTIPNDAPALEVNHEYQWSLVLMCDNQLRPDSPVVQGDVMRVAANSYLTDKLAQSDLLESAALYGKEGIWYDTLASLAKLKSTSPKDQDIAASWENLLSSVGLEEVARAEFVE